MDFEVDLKRRNVSLTEVGSEKAERMLGVETLYSESGEDNELPHLVENAIRAEHIYLKDREYVVRNGEIVLVDEFTGRLMEGRRFLTGCTKRSKQRKASAFGQNRLPTPR